MKTERGVAWRSETERIGTTTPGPTLSATALALRMTSAALVLSLGGALMLGAVELGAHLVAAGSLFALAWHEYDDAWAAASVAGLGIALLPSWPAALVLAAAVPLFLLARDGRPWLAGGLAVGWWLGVAGQWASVLAIVYVAALTDWSGETRGAGARRGVLGLTAVLALLLPGLLFDPTVALTAVVFGVALRGYRTGSGRSRSAAPLARAARWAAGAPAGLLLVLASIGGFPTGTEIQFLLWGWAAAGIGVWVLIWAFGVEFDLQRSPAHAASALAPVLGGALIVVLAGVRGDLIVAGTAAALSWGAMALTFPLGLARFFHGLRGSMQIASAAALVGAVAAMQAFKVLLHV